MTFEKLLFNLQEIQQACVEKGLSDEDIKQLNIVEIGMLGKSKLMAIKFNLAFDGQKYYLSIKEESW